jgi:hypothetical protein
MRVERYHKNQLLLWNVFVERSPNGHFMFDRGYMDYHSDRFKDHSLLFFIQERLMAILPANELDGRLYSHQGLSFGGLILGTRTYCADVLKIFSSLREYMLANSLTDLTYKVMPWIYNSGTREESIYALFVNKAELFRRDVSSVIDLRSEFKYRSTKEQNIKKGLKNGLTWREPSNVRELWTVVNEVLLAKHDSEPTHNVEEMELLISRFAEQIKAFEVLKDDRLLGGCVLFINGKVVHTQYMAVTDEGRAIGALDYLVHNLIEYYKSEKSYFSFGISTEEGGTVLNEGLIFQKEGFGATGLVHDFYRLSV